MMVGDNLNDVQLQQLVDRTIIKADTDKDGKISFDEFSEMVKDLDVIDKLTINCWKTWIKPKQLKISQSAIKNEIEYVLLKLPKMFLNVV